MEFRTIDTLIKIKNGYMANRVNVLVYRTFESNLVLDFLLKHYYIATYSPVDRTHYAVRLRYVDGKAIINSIDFFSYPNKPLYMSFKDIKKTFSSKPSNLTLFRTSFPYRAYFFRNGVGADMNTFKQTGILELDDVLKLRTGAEVLISVT